MGKIPSAFRATAASLTVISFLSLPLSEAAAFSAAPDAVRGAAILAVADGAMVSEKIGAGARNYIDNMGRRALGFLGDDAMSQDQKKNSFRQLLNDSFDMATISRFALGRYWRETPPEQRAEYQKLFREMIVTVYSQRFQDYKGQKFETRSWRAENEKDIIVASFIIPEQGPEIQVDWRVRYKQGRYQIVDVVVEGVSMSVTQRSDFASVIQRGGGNVQVLLDHLRQKP